VGAMEESFGRGNVKILEMLKEGYHDNRTGFSRNEKHNIENEQWELFNKYGNKFGIKAQECKDIYRELMSNYV